jgi:hypothetical protein
MIKFLNEMDELREMSNVAVDEALKEVDLKPIILDPNKAGEAFKLIIVRYISKNRKLFAQALLEGKKLAKTL